MEKIALKQIAGLENFDPLAANDGGCCGFDTYHLDQGNLIVTKTTFAITDQVVTNGELILTIG